MDGDLHKLLANGEVGEVGYKGNLKVVTETFTFGASDAVANMERFDSSALVVPGNSILLGIRVIRDFNIGFRWYRGPVGGLLESKYFASTSAGVGQEDVSGHYTAATVESGINYIGTVFKNSSVIVPRALSAISAANANRSVKVMLFYVNI